MYLVYRTFPYQQMARYYAWRSLAISKEREMIVMIKSNDLKNTWLIDDYLLNHIENGLVLVQPYIMIRDGHGLKSDLFGIFEEAVWPPNSVEPIHWQQTILSGHVVRQYQTMVFPLLGKEHVSCVRLEEKTDKSGDLRVTHQAPANWWSLFSCTVRRSAYLFLWRTEGRTEGHPAWK